jgi:Uma2 family endonuclease
MATHGLVAPAEYLRTSYGERDREYRNGEVVERGMPTYLHGKLQLIIGFLFLNLRQKFLLYPSSEVRIEIVPGEVYRIPDVAVFAGEEPVGELVQQVPLVAVEIGSPDDRISDMLTKFAEYESFGIRHIWFVDGEKRKLFVYEQALLRQVEAFSLPEFEFEMGLKELGLAE